jgi:leucyl-tRNA---protein transferase
MSAGNDTSDWTLGRMSADLRKYFYDIPAQCPYDLPYLALYHQALLGFIPDAAMSQFMAAGFRRSGNNLYQMRCPECRQCVPIRLNPAEFKPNRGQRRTWGKNLDLTIECTPLHATAEKLSLCNKFLQSRYPGRGNSAGEYYFGFFQSTITNAFELEYRTPEGHLVGVAVVDVGSNWLNAVYFYFDPAEAARSPGTFNILYLLDLCLQRRIDHLYLGYWINGVQAMNYKAGFKPHQLLIKQNWITQGTR